MTVESSRGPALPTPGPVHGKSHRQAHCGHCNAIFYVCRHCDRGQVYCSSRCRTAGRRASQRRARRRHQASPEGRLDHRDRQRLYRARLRERERAGESVTDTSSPTALVCGTQADALIPSPPPQEGTHDKQEVRLAVSRSTTEYTPRCAFCRAEAEYIHFDSQAHWRERRKRR